MQIPPHVSKSSQRCGNDGKSLLSKKSLCEIQICIVSTRKLLIPRRNLVLDLVSKSWSVFTWNRSQNFLYTLLAASCCCFMQRIPPAVVSTVSTKTSSNQPPNLPPAARASCSSYTGHGVSITFCEVHTLRSKITSIYWIHDFQTLKLMPN